MRYATLVRDELIRLDLKNKAVYEQNAAQFLKKLRPSTKPSKKRLKRSRKTIAAYHLS